MTLTTVPARFARQVSQTPDAIALVQGDQQFTYAELDLWSVRLAHRLLGHGVRPGDRIALLTGRSLEGVVAMLAVLRIGAAYVPLDLDLPRQRRDRILQECRPRLLLTAPGDAVNTDGLPVDLRALASEPTHDPGVEVHPDDLMYVTFTSGSTGAPKGSLIPHRAVVGFFEPASYAEWGPHSVAYHHSALSWDGHVLDLYPALLTGGRVVVHQGGTSPEEVVRGARHAGVTVLWLTAQSFHTVVNVEPRLLKGLRWLLTGGETVSPTHVARALAAVPELQIVNGYGPSECTVFSTAQPITPAELTGAALPIGSSVGDRRVHLLAPDGRPTPDGEPGEVHVGGPAVAHGYLNRPRLTAERFVPDPFTMTPGQRLYRTGDLARARDGRIEFLGRADDQIKLRGFRIELGEIEQALNRHPSVAAAAVAVDRTSAAGDRLVGYLVPSGNGRPEHDELRGFLGDQLPTAMVPALYTWLDRLPLTRNGKLDRAALPAPEETSSAHEPPRSETERILADVWREVLGVDRVGRLDDFLELGGNSLHATQVTSRIALLLGVRIRLPKLYEKTRLAALAMDIESLRRTQPAPTADRIGLRRRGDGMTR